MRHIITGGSGFTGKVLTRLLLKTGNTVVHFDQKPVADGIFRERIQTVTGDIRNRDDVERLNLAAGDVIYHLAARQFANDVPKRNRDEWFSEVNVNGTQIIVDAMQKAGSKKLVFFSTDMTYGNPGICPIPPDCEQKPLGPYGRSKLLAEKILMNAEGINATIFRPRLITGSGRLGILGKLFGLIYRGLPVPMIGDGSNRYQMVGVDDCARAAMLAVRKGCPPGPFNLGSKSPPTTYDLLTGIIAHAKSRSRLLPIPAPAIKAVLSAMDRIGATLLYPEQFMIADADIMLETSGTVEQLGWSPSLDDVSMMNAAYDAFITTRR
ncbi:NAD(P)-dependent oxidoreductase [Asaia sp. SF2.1]|uniref:NAD-dependent epimerase/dehydratase family protein n=1 Tax=Asaia sp. SF2.1 TaxID=406101 RepID=UPI0003D3607C|nr:NAD(P)-dependent oxidoreductase [Asaia sp. SF2.1]ETC98463.1 epimerase [Asaia sp. SF2.1]